MVSRVRRSWRVAVLAAAAVSLVLVGGAATAARASSGSPPSIAAGPASGYVPSRNANHGGGNPHNQVPLLQYHNGPVQTSTTQVYPIYWGPAWGSTYSATKGGLDTFYNGVGGTPYAHTTTEYYNGSLTHVSSSVHWNSDYSDTSSVTTNGSSTNAVLQEVSRATGGHPVAGAYYPVYSDQPRGSAGFCAWHSVGTINGTEVQFGFFFSLKNDPGCDPVAGASNEQLAALGNVSGHELSEMLTDPQLNAWYDQQGAENSDKCAWTFSGTVAIGGQNWKIQGNWSNAAANTHTGYGSGSYIGCIETS